MSLVAVAATARRRFDAQPPPYEFPTTSPYNVPVPAITPTPDGSGQAMHPGVLDFGGVRFNGWRFWMAMTPLPDGSEPLENPCILVSNDGYLWREPPGLTNPVYPWPGYSFNSDTDLVYDSAEGELFMIYKGPAASPNNFPLLCGRSSDGVSWSTPPAPVTYAAGAAPTEQHVSPSVLKTPSGSWLMWTVGYPSYAMTRWEADAPEGPWSNPLVCSGISAAWHIEVTLDGGVYRMLYNRSSRSSVRAAASVDGITWTDGADLIVQGQNAWDSAAFYRSSLTMHEGGDRFRVWYSGSPGGNSWALGYTEIPLTEWPAIP